MRVARYVTCIIRCLKSIRALQIWKKEKRSHEARPEELIGRDNTVSFSDFKVSSQTQMYLMEHFHEVDEQA